MKTKLKKVTGSAVLAGLLFAAASAQAVDLRSWDQKINDATRRFVVLPAFNNQAVLDKETQLVWQRTPGTGTVSHHLADNFCGRTPIGGRTGWRLPTSTELMSLIDSMITDPTKAALPAGHPFINVRSLNQGRYWTTTPLVWDHAQKLTIGMTGEYFNGLSGYWTYYPATMNGSYAAAWCVRGPTSAGH